MKLKIKLVKELVSGEKTIAVDTVIEVGTEYAAELKEAGIGIDFVEPIDKDISVVEAEVKAIEDKVEVKKVIDEGPKMTIEVKDRKVSPEMSLRKTMILAKARATNDFSADASKYAMEEKAIIGQGEAVNVGGALVANQLSNEIYDVAMTTGIVAAKAQTQVIGSGYNGLTVRQNKGTTGTYTNYKGIALGVFAEGATITPASIVGFTSSTAAVNKLIALNYQTNDIIEDVPGITNYISQLVGEAFGFALDAEILYGTNNLLTPLVGDLSVGTSALVGAADVTPATLNDMIAKCSNLGRAEWYMSGKTFYNVIQGLEDTEGHRIVQPNLLDPLKPIILGFPVNIISCMEAAAAAQVDIMFGSVGDGYILGTKGGIRFAKSLSLEFLTDQSVFRWVLRVAGLPTNYSVITLEDGRTVSPMVSIARS